MDKIEFMKLRPGDIVYDRRGKGNYRKIKEIRYFGVVPYDPCGYTVQSLRPNGVFKNFLGKTCKNRKEIGIYPYMAMHFDKFAKS